MSPEPHAPPDPSTARTCLADAPALRPVRLSAEFAEELARARRRVAVLEEANRAIHESLDRIARLSAFSEGLDRSGSVEDVARLLFDEVGAVLPVRLSAFALCDEDGDRFEVLRVEPAAAAASASEELGAQVAAGMVRWALNLRRPMMVNGAALGRNLVLVPLATARRCVGMLLLATALEAEAVEQQHLTLTSVLARQATEYLDNLRLAEDIRRHNEDLLARRVADLGLLVETAHTLSGRRDAGEVAQLLVPAAAARLAVGAAGLWLAAEDGTLTPAASIGLPADAPALPPLQPARAGRACAIPDLRADARTAAFAAVTGLVSLLAVPLVAHDQPLGVLAVLSAAAREFSQDEVALLTGLAAQGAMAVENGRLLADLQARMQQQQEAVSRLVQASRMASVGLVAGGVAHDINNPLCIMSNQLQLLRLDPGTLPARVERGLSTLEGCVARISASVEALLDYTQGWSGERRPADLNDSVRRILVLLQYHPACRALRVRATLAAELPRVLLDRPAWEQALLELFLNAREAAGAEAEVWIETRRVAATEQGEPDGVEVTLTDAGAGIADEDLAHIFDPFFTTKASKRGIGLGLKICRDIVEAHGGRLRVERRAGQGTRIAIELRGVGAGPDPGADERPAEERA